MTTPSHEERGLVTISLGAFLVVLSPCFVKANRIVCLCLYHSNRSCTCAHAHAHALGSLITCAAILAAGFQSEKVSLKNGFNGFQY